MNFRTEALIGGLVVASLLAPVGAQAPKPPAARSPVEKLGANSYRVGTISVDTARREVSVPGTLNEVTTVEFVANARDGLKAYESAVTLETDAITFNAALLLIGLDPARGKPSAMQFDSVAPRGDAVELFVELPADAKGRRVQLEEILYDQRTLKALAAGPWVYTGSTFVTTEDGPRFMAAIDGVLIGLMHGPSALIDNPRNDLIGRFGSINLNPAIAKAGMTVSLIVRALPPTSPNKKH